MNSDSSSENGGPLVLVPVKITITHIVCYNKIKKERNLQLTLNNTKIKNSNALWKRKRGEKEVRLLNTLKYSK